MRTTDNRDCRLTDLGLDDVDVQRIADAVRAHPHVQTLELHGNAITDVGATALLTVLREPTGTNVLHTVELYGNPAISSAVLDTIAMAVVLRRLHDPSVRRLFFFPFFFLLLFLLLIFLFDFFFLLSFCFFSNSRNPFSLSFINPTLIITYHAVHTLLILT